MTAPGQQAARILVVDDDPPVLRALRRYLRSAGFEVETAESGAAAWARMEVQKFDALLTDDIMPHMRGSELVARVHARWPDLPIVMNAGQPPEPLPAGLAKYLRKPSDHELLAETLEQLTQARPRG